MRSVGDLLLLLFLLVQLLLKDKTVFVRLDVVSTKCGENSDEGVDLVETVHVFEFSRISEIELDLAVTVRDDDLTISRNRTMSPLLHCCFASNGSSGVEAWSIEKIGDGP